MHGCIVLPTYNERENLEILLPQLCPPAQKYNLDILVVDDYSPDKTATFVKHFAYNKRATVKIHLLLGKKEGLGKACVRAFQWCLQRNYDFLMTMDADLSHNPSYIPKFMTGITKNDVVIGSRYILGGNIIGWNLRRKWISKGGNLFARFIAGLHEIHDATTGYRAYQCSMLRKIDLISLPVKGYAFQLRMLYELSRQGARIMEVPIVFVDRIHGNSKLGLRDILEFFIDALRIRFSR